MAESPSRVPERPGSRVPPAGDTRASAIHEQMLLELSQWLARVQQYSTSHPACAHLGERTHAALVRSLSVESPLTLTIGRDSLDIGDVPVQHPAPRSRIGARLHERGIVALRFASGITSSELRTLVELLTLPVSTTFDRGGLKKLILEHGIARVTVDELAHDISAEEREGARRRHQLRSFFADSLRALIAQRGFKGLLGEQLLELLDRPDVAVVILEEDPTAICESFAGLCLMVRNEQERTGDLELSTKLRTIYGRLSSSSHARVVIGLPSLVAEFRQALHWFVEGLPDEELARTSLPAFRSHTSELEVVFYALSVALPHDGRRLSVLRRLALHFYDLPADDAADGDLLALLARPAPDFDSYRRERDVLASDAARALAMRTTFEYAGDGDVSGVLRSGAPPPPFEANRVMMDLVKVASRTRRFDQLCAKIPGVSASLARAGSTDAVVGLMRGLQTVQRPEWKELATRSLRASMTAPVAAQLFADLEATSAGLEGAALEELTHTLRLLVALNPQAALAHLETSESRKVRRILMELLASIGAPLLPLVRVKLESPQWFVVRNAIALLPRLGGSTRDVVRVARHPEERVRIEVIRVLRTLPMDETGMDIIADLLTDKSADVRNHAGVMIRGELLTAHSIPALERVAADESHPEAVRRRCVEALGRSPLDAAATALYALLQPRGLIELGTIRDLAAMMLRSSPAPLARGYFEEGLKSPVWRVRKACERALGGGG
ncbi:MAG: HEAT repeat domain-containing protein [Deltaproteobacteria bacterium]|nr:HEAT repeat domain-containing protein [Deltaproteobacteria bacterium]